MAVAQLFHRLFRQHLVFAIPGKGNDGKCLALKFYTHRLQLCLRDVRRQFHMFRFNVALLSRKKFIANVDIRVRQVTNLEMIVKYAK